MVTSKALNIVSKVLANHAYFKAAARDLEKLAPDLPATHALVDAFRNGSAPAWMAAHLLGCIGHEDAYPIVREILVSAPGSLAESYAGVALAKIRGERAIDDLRLLLTEAPHKASREGAAYGLQHLGGAVAIRTVAAAGRDGHIQTKVAASILGALSSSSELLRELLDSGLERGLLIATWTIEFRDSTPDRSVQPWTTQETRALVEAFRRSLERHGGDLSKARRRRLDQWMARHSGAELA